MDPGIEDQYLIAEESPEPGRWRGLLIGFGVWTALAVFFSVRGILYYYRGGEDIPWAAIISSAFVDFYLWGAVSPLIFAISKRFPVERTKVVKRLLLHLVLSHAIAWIMTQLSGIFYWYFGAPNLERYPSLGFLLNKTLFDAYLLHQNTLVYWIILLTAHTMRYNRQLRDREKQAAQFTAQTARLSEQLAQAQLYALKMQVHPHFLFNTLNGISALLDTDVKAANRMIARLSEFLRMTLKNSEAPAATLDKELEFLRTYLEIEKIRFQDRLTVKFDVDPHALGAIVPNLILQPLVENAVRHGFAQQTRDGLLKISARPNGNRLLIEIDDNGPGVGGGKSANEGEGVGLANTKARLQRFYEGDFSFQIAGKQDARGTLVTLDLPCIFDHPDVEPSEDDVFIPNNSPDTNQ